MTKEVCFQGQGGAANKYEKVIMSSQNLSSYQLTNGWPVCGCFNSIIHYQILKYHETPKVCLEKKTAITVTQ